MHVSDNEAVQEMTKGQKPTGKVGWDPCESSPGPETTIDREPPKQRSLSCSLPRTEDANHTPPVDYEYEYTLHG